jgi:hypothetical protein
MLMDFGDAVDLPELLLDCSNVNCWETRQLYQIAIFQFRGSSYRLPLSKVIELLRIYEKYEVSARAIVAAAISAIRKEYMDLNKVSFAFRRNVNRLSQYLQKLAEN